jgi:phosphoribosylanthranilate isomerase
MKVKICGNKDVANFTAVSELNPDLVGFIFYPKSPRYVDDSIRGSDFKSTYKELKRVGVFVDMPLDQVLEKSKVFGLDYCQLHGDESLEYTRELYAAGQKIIKVFRIGQAGFDSLELLSFEKYCDYFLFDTRTDQYGGSGKKFDWSLLNQYSGNLPFFLSGGIGPADLEALNSIEHPRFVGIDLNSKFEITPGIKDVESLKQFFTEIKNNKPYELFN